MKMLKIFLENDYVLLSEINTVFILLYTYVQYTLKTRKFGSDISSRSLALKPWRANGFSYIQLIM